MEQSPIAFGEVTIPLSMARLPMPV